MAWKPGGSCKAASDSAGADQDVILDFAPGTDLIDLAALLGTTDLAWGGTIATPNGAWYQPANGNTLVYADLNGNTTADFRIQINGLHALTAVRKKTRSPLRSSLRAIL